jgi:spermidine synthase
VRIVRNGDPRPLGLSSRLPAFLLGFMAASFQIYLLREFAAEFTGNELTFGLVLGSWLLWGGLGSLIRPAKWASTGRPVLARLYGATAALFAVSLALLRFSHKVLGLLPAELSGLGPALGFALLTAFFLSFPLGHAFVLNSGRLGGDVGLVYILESAGAAAAGLSVHFLLIPGLSNWQGAAAVTAVTALAAMIAVERRGPKALPALALVLAVGLALLDGASLRAAWRPLDLVDAKDTPYGKLLVVRNAEQVTLYDNGLTVFSRPDLGASEDAVHFAMLQRENTGRVLLVGGTASGCLEEVLKYPGVRVDCVELDPAVIGLARKHLSAPELAALDDPRVRIFTRDGRSFLERAAGRYDAVLLDLPEPATAQVNRYYTREFFAEVRETLSPGGVLSFVVPGAENYISPPLGQFLSSIAATLGAVFPEVALVPGSSAVFLASDGPLTLDPGRLSERIAARGLGTRFVSPGMLPSRLDPSRVERLLAGTSSSGARINRDLVPVSYYFHTLLWAGQFRGLESRLLRTAGTIPPFWFLEAPLALFALVLILVAALRRRSPVRFLVPIAVMGFTSIVVELCLFIAFQANFGIVYGKIPLLLASFMAGLVAGAALARRRRRPGLLDVGAVEAGFVVLLLLTSLGFSGAGGELVPFALLAGFGLLGGYLFVSANRFFLREIAHPGLGYGVDLLASFAGVVFASALLIPLFGVPALVLRLAVLNALVLLFTLVTFSR